MYRGIRGFLVTEGLWGLAGVAALVLASCGGGEGTPAPTGGATPTTLAPTVSSTPTPAPTVTPEAAAKRGGILNLRLLQAWPVRDPYDNRGGFAQQLTSSLMNTLVTTNPYNLQTSEEIVGDLATRWEATGDGTRYVFQLQKGVQWHDGGSLTSQDVAYTYGRATNPPSPSVAFQKERFVVVDRVEAPDVSTVVITLKRPSAAFLRGIALTFAKIMPSHIQDMAVFNRTLVGTGPYKLKAETTNVEIVVERNPNYFKSGLPYLDGVRYFIIPDANNAFAAFRTGQILAGNGTYDGDFMGPQGPVIKRGIPGIKFQSYTAARMDVLMNSAHPALADKRVRQAIHLGLDYRTLNETWLEGKATPWVSLMLPSSRGGKWALPEEELTKVPGFNPAAKASDRSRATELLKEAGFPQGLRLRWSLSTFEPYNRLGEIFATLMKPIGVDLAVRVQTTTEQTNDWLRGDFDLGLNSSSTTFDDPDANVAIVVKTGAGRNYGKWSFPRLDQLLDEQDRTFDEAKRRELIHEIQREVLKDLPIIPLGYWGGEIFWRDDVKNYPRCYYSQSPCYTWEQVWLDR